MKKGLVFLLLLFLGSIQLQGQQRAFPEAEGYGSYAKGGRGGQVMLVTNLNDTGPGSLRAAVEAEGPRVVLFEVGGIIDLKSALELRNPEITIAGQTAPPPGITLRGHEFSIRASEVIIRHIRFRPGDYLARESVDWGALDALSIRSDHPWQDPVENIILDHCSFSWGADENISIWHNARRVTIQNSIISEGLRYHPYNRNSNGQGLLIGSNATDISILRTLFAGNYERNPYMNANGHLDFRNNIIYNGGDRIMRFFNAHGEQQRVNLVNNLILEGPSSLYKHEIFIRLTSQTRIYNGLLWLDGNHTSRSSAATAYNWLMVHDEESGAPFPTGAQAGQEFPVPRTTTLAADKLTELLPVLGAVLPGRDQIDRRIVRELERGEGEHVTFPRQVLGWGAVPPGERPVSVLFEEWLRQTGSDLAEPALRNRLDEQGYTELERFLNELAREEPLPWQGGTSSSGGSFMAMNIETAGSSEPGIRNTYPNPFREQAIIRISIERPETYRLDVYNTAGRRVQTLANRWMVEGEYELQWEPGSIASGVYLVRLVSSEGQWVRRVVRVR